jgi:hypothetical protein
MADETANETKDHMIGMFEFVNNLDKFERENDVARITVMAYCNAHIQRIPVNTLISKERITEFLQNSKKSQGYFMRNIRQFMTDIFSTFTNNGVYTFYVVRGDIFRVLEDPDLMNDVDNNFNKISLNVAPLFALFDKLFGGQYSVERDKLVGVELFKDVIELIPCLFRVEVSKNEFALVLATLLNQQQIQDLDGNYLLLGEMMKKTRVALCEGFSTKDIAQNRFSPPTAIFRFSKSIPTALTLERYNPADGRVRRNRILNKEEIDEWVHQLIRESYTILCYNDLWKREKWEYQE